MNIQKLEKILDPKNQGLPEIKLEVNNKKAEIVIIPVFEEDKGNLKKGESKDEITAGRIIRRIGVGKKADFNARETRRFYGSAYNTALANKPNSIAFETCEKCIKWAVVGILTSALNPSLFKPKFKAPKAPQVILVNKGFKNSLIAKKALKQGQILAEGKNLIRILGAAPPNILNPKSYCDLVQKLAKKWKVKVNRVPKTKLTKYELLNAVSLGSKYNSELLVFTLNPKKGKSKKSRAVIGKGICFDSGGIISKQNQMNSMKEDMAGSAIVLATVLQVAKGNIKIKKTTHVLMAIAENMMGTDAMRVDDIWTAGDGQTVEIVHTDAEGRLVLGDAICYAKNNYKEADEFITIATLTGSCLRAFGEDYTGVICNKPDVTNKVIEAGKSSGDYVVAGPWDMAFDAPLNSDVADIGNLTSDPNGGWIYAAMYLNRFVPKNSTFIHFDIAGSIDMYEKGRTWRKKGFNSGVSVSLFSELLES